MEGCNFVSWENIGVVSAFALAWFIVGILTGQRLSAIAKNDCRAFILIFKNFHIAFKWY